MQKTEVLKSLREIGLVPVLRAESESQALGAGIGYCGGRGYGA